MMFYLDNYNNVVGHAQENYARELMELHSLSVKGGYTQSDVEEVARCLTGWTFFGPASGQYGNFRFAPGSHDNGAKTVLGVNIPPNGGITDGETVLDILAYHPSTAGFIAQKLCRWFLGYNPPEDIIETAQATYLATGGDIKDMLRVILHPTAVAYLAEPKFKRPFHLVASLLRATDADVLSPRYLLAVLYAMGHLPFYWAQPDGYPDSLEAWGPSLHPRWDFAAGALSFPAAVSVDLPGLLDSEGGNVPGEQAAAIDRILTGGRLSAEELSLIQAFYDDPNTPPGVALSDAFGLAASVPGYQWY